jgi:magnesium chelatase family protein
MQYQAARYWSRLSGPFLDRIDLQIEISRLSEVELCGNETTLNSEQMYLRVKRAVHRQRGRFAEGEPFVYNGQLSSQQVKRFCKIDSTGQELLARAVSRMGLSARACDRILRIARTIADLDDCAKISNEHLADAISWKSLNLGQIL